MAKERKFCATLGCSAKPEPMRTHCKAHILYWDDKRMPNETEEDFLKRKC